MLRTAREKAGLTQLQLATELDVQVKQYQRLEYGERSFSSVNIRLGLKICRILQIDPYELVLGEKESGLHEKRANRPPGKNKHYRWDGHKAYSDPTGNRAIYNVCVEWNRKRRLAIKIRLKGEKPDPTQFYGIFKRLLTDPLEELIDDSDDY